MDNVLNPRSQNNEAAEVGPMPMPPTVDDGHGSGAPNVNGSPGPTSFGRTSGDSYAGKGAQ